MAGDGREGEGRLRKEEVERRLQGWNFGVGRYIGKGDEEEYGIIATRDKSTGVTKMDRCLKRKKKWDSPGREWLRQPTTSLESTGGLLLLCGLLGLILYYVTSKRHTAFEHFMLGQTFGSRVLFTALGVIISLFWDGYYSRKSSPFFPLMA